MPFTNRMIASPVTPTIVSITDQDDIHDTTAGPTAEARYQLQSSGQARKYTSTSGYVNISNEWLVSGTSSEFEVKATIVSGTVTSGTIGSWEVLSSDREWTRDRNVIGSVTVVLTIEIRRASDGAILDTATVTLIAEIS